MELSITLISFFSVVISAALSIVAIPKIISLAISKRLFDMPDNGRKVHTRIVPYLGGVAIFGSAFITSVLLLDHTGFEKWSYVRAATLLLFFIGIKDDISDLKAMHKLVVQLLAAVIVVVMADIRVGNFYGLFGMHELPLWFSYIFSVIGIAFVANAFNLIDGVDGLAGSVGTFAALVFGLFFAAAGQSQYAVLSFTLFGAIVGFLVYNKAPASIFMGDTGSLFIGFMLAVLSICFVNSQPVYYFLSHSGGIVQPGMKFIIVLAALFIPVFDTLRVFAMRALKGHSPFRADRNHLHHYLLDIGFSHNKIVVTLLLSSALLLVTCGLGYSINIHFCIAAMLTIAIGLFAVLRYLRNQRMDVTTADAVSAMGQQMNMAATAAQITLISSQHEQQQTDNDLEMSVTAEKEAEVHEVSHQ